MRLTKHIPNTITLVNLFCGILAVIFGIKGWLHFSVYLIITAAIFDFCDGFAARLLKAYSPMGKELDSLADMVSFGVLPSVIVYILLKQSLGIYQFSFDLSIKAILVLLFPFIIAVFSGLRLAKFNIDERQTESFVGLPTPANAIFLCSLPLISGMGENAFFNGIILNPWFLIISSLF